MKLFIAAEEPLEGGVVDVDGGVGIGDVDVKVDDDGEEDTVGLGLVRAPAELFMAETVREGGNEALGAIVIFLVEHGATTVEGSGVDGDEEGTREVGYPREYASIQRVFKASDRGEHGERLEDLRDVAVFLCEVVEGASELGEMWDGGAVVATHAKEASGLLGVACDDGGGHVEDSAGAARVGADAIAANLISEPSQLAVAEVNLGGGDGKSSLVEAGEDLIEVGEVLVEIGGGSLGNDVIDVGKHEIRGEASKHLVDEPLEGGGSASKPLGHALVLE